MSKIYFYRKKWESKKIKHKIWTFSSNKKNDISAVRSFLLVYPSRAIRHRQKRSFAVRSEYGNSTAITRYCRMENDLQRCNLIRNVNSLIPQGFWFTDRIFEAEIVLICSTAGFSEMKTQTKRMIRLKNYKYLVYTQVIIISKAWFLPKMWTSKIMKILRVRQIIYQSTTCENFSENSLNYT